jgi:hypothetical protein
VPLFAQRYTQEITPAKAWPHGRGWGSCCGFFEKLHGGSGGQCHLVLSAKREGRVGEKSTRTLHTVEAGVNQSCSQEHLHPHTWYGSIVVARVGTKALPIAVGGAAHDDVGVALPAPSSCGMRERL